MNFSSLFKINDRWSDCQFYISLLLGHNSPDIWSNIILDVSMSVIFCALDWHLNARPLRKLITLHMWMGLVQWVEDLKQTKTDLLWTRKNPDRLTLYSISSLPPNPADFGQNHHRHVSQCLKINIPLTLFCLSPSSSLSYTHTCACVHVHTHTYIHTYTHILILFHWRTLNNKDTKTQI